MKNKTLIFNALALAMGVAGVVLTILKASNSSVLILYGVGLFCLAMNGLKKYS